MRLSIPVLIFVAAMAVSNAAKALGPDCNELNEGSTLQESCFLQRGLKNLDAELSAMQVKVNDPDFFRQSAEATTAILNQLQQTESKLAHAYARWEELDA